MKSLNSKLNKSLKINCPKSFQQNPERCVDDVAFEVIELHGFKVICKFHVY